MKLNRHDIWCMRIENRIISVSVITDKGKNSILIYLFGYRFWIGPNRPSFLTKGYRHE